jgi:hypothetical protein
MAAMMMTASLVQAPAARVRAAQRPRRAVRRFLALERFR